MNETHEGIQQKKPFLKRFILRDVQSTLGSIKRSVSSRVSLKQAPRPEPPAEQPSDSLPPYKELSLQKQAVEDVLEKLNKGYFEDNFDAVDFELTEVQHPIVQEDLDSKVDQLTTALEVQFSLFSLFLLTLFQVVSLQLSDRVLEKHDHFVNGIETVGSIESDLQVNEPPKRPKCVLFLASACKYGKCTDPCQSCLRRSQNKCENRETDAAEATIYGSAQITGVCQTSS